VGIGFCDLWRFNGGLMILMVVNALFNIFCINQRFAPFQTALWAN
jgi:hypothetical protein